MSALASFPRESSSGDQAVAYGPDIDDESTLRLLGQLDGARVLVLGAAARDSLVALSRAGAHVIVVESNAATRDAAVAHCTQEQTRVEFITGELAEFAKVRGDSVDVALSIYALASVLDLGRVFRQVHRVLRQECPLIFSLPHPMRAMFAGEDADLTVKRAYFATEPEPWSGGGATGVDHTHTISHLHTELTRANFRTDALLEPIGDPGPTPSPYWDERYRQVPATLIVRARKMGA